MNQELLCVYVTWGLYQYYMPIVAFSILSNYPKYYIRFILLDNLNPTVSKMFDALRSAGYMNFTIIPKRRLGLPNSHERFLLEESWFRGFDYAWIGDVDFMHIKELWLEKELDICSNTGMPYSNSILYDCISGCHFIIVKSYFEKMTSIIREYKSNPASYYGDTDKRVLYNLVKSGIGVSDKFPKYRDYHGIHLNQNEMNENLKILNQLADPLFLKIISLIDQPEIIRVYNKLISMISKKTIKLL
jgi:hypothetical protein